MKIGHPKVFLLAVLCAVPLLFASNCDDINVDCSAGCGGNSVCDPVDNRCEPALSCGNGNKEGDEECDDGDLDSGDGCYGEQDMNMLCDVEDGYTCEGTAPSVCTQT